MISQKIQNNLERSSWIRAMFEEGKKLAAAYGQENVYDYTLGNPSIEPPQSIYENAQKILREENNEVHKYMNNAGYDDVREKVAEFVSKTKDVNIKKENIVMTCGAAGGLNVVLKTILNPGDEVIVFSPYFVEYLFYIDNHQGKPVIVETYKDTFEPDPDKLESSITTKTKAIIINSPNNPTGVVYSEVALYNILKVIEKKENEFGINILVISDEPYAQIVFDDIQIPSILKTFPNSVVVNSFSKSHSIPGERIGYIAASPNIDNVNKFMDGLIFANRVLGYVNAPSLFQKVIALSLNETIDIDYYKKRRDMLYNYLVNIGFDCIKPQGAFYLFPRAPISDDVEFKNIALKHKILIVPGVGFGCPGYFRLSYCVNMDMILRSLPAFDALASESIK